MPRSKIFLFGLGAFSILALVAFFVLASFVGRLGQMAAVQEAGFKTTNNQSQEIISNINQNAGPDPLITPGEPFYAAVVRETDPVFSSGDGLVKIIEFGDFQCPYSLQVESPLNKILLEFKGKAALIWKDFANPAHTEARGAAIAARCADKQGKFWEYHDYLFENQDNLSRDLYNKIALELKLDLATFNKCVDGQETVELVGQGMADGQQIGVDATPYIIIGKRVFNYALSEEELRQAVEKELENQENKKAKNQ